MQSRFMSGVESVANVLVGYWVAVGTNVVVFPLMGIYSSFGTDMKIAAIFTVISLIRSYSLRRLFERKRIAS